jgi:hypothetical protein
MPWLATLVLVTTVGLALQAKGEDARVRDAGADGLSPFEQDAGTLAEPLRGEDPVKPAAAQTAATVDAGPGTSDAHGPVSSPPDDAAVASDALVIRTGGSVATDASPAREPAVAGLSPSAAATAQALEGVDNGQAGAAVAMVAKVSAARPHVYSGRLGLGLDLGVSGVLPDAGLLLIVRPVRWGQLQVGGGYNGLSGGIRGGITLVNPFVIPLSVSWEVGHYFEGDANRIVQWFSPSTQDNASLRRFSYDYMNLLGGIAVGGGDFAFYLRVGVTWMRTTVHGFEQSVRDQAHIQLTASDPTIHYRGPALKLGFNYFL